MFVSRTYYSVLKLYPLLELIDLSSAVALKCGSDIDHSFLSIQKFLARWESEKGSLTSLALRESLYMPSLHHYQSPKQRAYQFVVALIIVISLLQWDINLFKIETSKT